MSRATLPVLFAHERPGIAHAVQRVLELEGFTVTAVQSGEACKEALQDRRWAGLVVDVALPGVPGYELTAIAKDPSRPDAGAQAVVLVASVYRRTSYKRRPSRLYGADDYVEIHHLCDSLPLKLHEHLGTTSPTSSPALEAQEEARQALREEGDTRMEEERDHGALAELIVADMVLYNGDAIIEARDLAAAEAAVAGDISIARELYRQVLVAEGASDVEQDAIGEAFGRLMKSMHRGDPR